MWVYPEIRTLGDIPRYHARERPGAPALVAGERILSFEALDQASSRMANALLALGLATPSRIGYLGQNTPELAVCLFGAAKAGHTFLPLNWRLAAPELADILGDSECSLLFFDDAYAPLALRAAALCVKPPRLVALGSVHPGAQPLADFLGNAGDTDPALAVSLETTAVQVYTSGTTGLPKGVELSHENFNHIRLCEHLDPGIVWTPEDVFLMFMPNFHTAGTGLMLQSLYNGSCTRMIAAFEPQLVFDAIDTSRPSIMLIVPSALQMLLEHPRSARTDYSCFRLVMYAGSPIALPLITRAMKDMPCRFVQWYGATEMVGAVTLLRADQHRLDREDQLKSCGTPVPLSEVKVVDAQGHSLPPRAIGEIVVRIPSIFKGYWKKPAETAAVKRNGWYRTGDAGFFDEEGFLYIHDRIKDMIVSGGENVYSAEVERALLQHPAVSDAAVIGVPDPKWGEAVKALVILRQGQAAGEAELIAHCRGLIAGYKAPKSVDFVADFPRTGSGKVQKAVLRAPYWQGASRPVA